jgi:uncharacterized protein YbjT (DUF2867 family)
MMRIAITGGTGFVGTHVARRLFEDGHEVVLVARGTRVPGPALRDRPGVTVGVSDLSEALPLQRAFSGCEAVMHCAGINREIGRQTYEKVHIEGTQNVVEAARHAGVRKIVFMSFLRARPNCGSAYHESKWTAEEMVRRSGLDHTILKSGMVYGRGDHMLDHLSRAFFTFPHSGDRRFQSAQDPPGAHRRLGGNRKGCFGGWKVAAQHSGCPRPGGDDFERSRSESRPRPWTACLDISGSGRLSPPPGVLLRVDYESTAGGSRPGTDSG